MLRYFLMSSIFCCSICFAQEPTTSANDTPKHAVDSVQATQSLQESLTGPPTWHGMVTNVPGDWVKYYHITFRDDKIGQYGAIAVMTGILIATDDQTWQFSKKLNAESNTVKSASNFFSEFINYITGMRKVLWLFKFPASSFF